MRHVASLSLVVSALAAGAGAQQLFPAQTVTTVFSVRDIAGADMDGDGDRDLVAVGGSSTASAGLWLNDGRGGLSLAGTPSTVQAAQRVRLLDLNLDGHLDVLAVCAGPTGGVAGSLGDGAAGFFATTWRAIVGGPRDIDVGDVNGDGWPDAATANGNTASAAVLLGLGTGGFGPPLNLPAGSQPCGVALTDIDGDGDADLAVANTLGATVTLRLNAAGILGAAATHAAGAQPTALLAAPLDGDALPDLLVACNDGTLRLLRADGAGSLLPPLGFATLPLPVMVEAEDLDVDGDLDVITAHAFPASGGALGVLLNDGAGQFAAPVSYMTGSSLGLDAGDLDGDLLPDVAASRQDSSFSVLRGDGLGALESVPVFIAGSAPWRVAFGDLTGDDALDLVAGSGDPAAVTWRAGTGALGFGPASSLPSSSGQFLGELVLADASGDGLLDVLTANSDKAQVGLLAGDGAGGLLPVVTYACGSDVRSLVAADLDGDADADVVACNSASNSVSVLRGGGGVLQPAVNTSVAGGHPTAIAMGHHNLDGAFDVITANEFSGNCSLLLGDGAAGWQPVTLLAGDAAWVRAATMADLDGDADDEFLAIYQAGGALGGRLVVRFSDGVANFSGSTTISLQSSPIDVVAADFDVDGALDVAVAHSSGLLFAVNRVDVLRGDGDGALAAPEAFLFGRPIDGLAVADLDGDGRPELAGASALEADVSLLANISGEFQEWTVLGFALPGEHAPKLAGAGSLLPGTPGALTLFDAPPLAPGAMFFATSSTPLPFKGGTLVPASPGLTLLLVIPADGRVRITWDAWPPVASGSSFFFQGAAVDAGAPAGVALSNALEALVP